MAEWTLQQAKQVVTEWRQRLHAGELYESLGPVVGQTIQSVTQVAATPVIQLSLEEVRDLLRLMTDLQLKLANQEGILLDDQDLLCLLQGLAQTDPLIRDAGVLNLMTELMQGGFLTQQQLHLMGRYLTQDVILFSHIQETANDGVFGRSYVMSVLSMVAYWGDRQIEGGLDPQLMDNMVRQIGTYLLLEVDGRGFVDDKGWAHAFVHVGHVLDAVAHNQHMPRMDKIFLFTLALERYKQIDVPMVTGESRRIVTALVNLLEMDEVYNSYFLNYLKQWRKELTQYPQPTTSAGWYRLSNQTQLLQALLLREQIPENIQAYLFQHRDFLS